MNDQELEKILLETLRISKENREYIIKIDRRQRWARNWRIFYWIVIVILAITGYYVAFPYLQTARDHLGVFTSQVQSFLDIASVTEGDL